ncbi:WD_REPEATS_REGION domain-containing protein, partial [Linnemannia schmuckeri]
MTNDDLVELSNLPLGGGDDNSATTAPTEKREKTRKPLGGAKSQYKAKLNVRGSNKSSPNSLAMNQLHLDDPSPVFVNEPSVLLVEKTLHKVQLQRLKEYRQPVYIPTMAKSSFQARDDDFFLLMDKVNEFLKSERQVMLILGDSGAGKSTFNMNLELGLLQAYKSGDPIPLFINLPSIRDPEDDMIGKQLKAHGFSKAQILNLKEHRQFILICDGYDESQLTTNLHTSNSFNCAGQWSVKLIISCRTQYLGQDYHGRFVPQRGSHYRRRTLALFQEAIIAPFSKNQIRNYVGQYVPLKPRTWTIQNYMEKLTTIPNLLNLVKNPFLLTLALETLPDVTEGKVDLSAVLVTRVQLYDIFVEHWLDVNKR